MRLTGIEVDRYGPLRGFSHEPDGGLEVLYGPNESGKTLLLEGICRLLAPDCAPLFGGMDRVDGEPVGALEVQRDGETVSVDGETTLVEDGRLTPRHLRNVFVIRDSDLRLAEEHAFYDSVTEQIGDLHTGELDALEGLCKERGRLTEETLSLSGAEEHDHAGRVRDDAATLAADLREYVAEAREEGVEETERRRLQVERELRAVEAELARQDVAETRHEHRELHEHLETYRDAVEALANASVSADELDHLQGLQRERREAEREAERVEADLAEARDERQAEREHLREVESKLEGYEAREGTVEEVRDQLAAIDAEAGAPGQRRLMTFVAALATAAVLGGGIAGGLGATIVGLVSLSLGVLAAGGWLALHRRRAAREQERAAVVDAARTAALDVEDVGEVRAAVESFEATFRKLDREREATAERVEHLEEDVGDLREDLATATDRVEAADEEMRTILDDAGVEDVEAYEERVAERQERASERDRAAAVLESRLPPDVEGATPGERIEAWEDALDDLLADVEDAESDESAGAGDGEAELADVDPDEYDPDRQADLEDRRESLTAEREEVATALDEHEARLRSFAERCRDLRAEPFLDEAFALPARSVEGLAAAADDLERLVERVDREADVAREAVDVLETVREGEEAKIARLFGDDGRAGEVLATITDDRYADVSYDAEARTLQVERADGEVLGPSALSHGTREQLYLAARVSLGEQLLGSEPGFFLLDDAFLPADRDRLERGFGVLDRLADAGWQIVYLTAKPEVGEEMAATYDLPVRELDDRL